VVITLCGSARFEEAFHHWNMRLSLDGHVVFGLTSYPSLHGGVKEWFSPEVKKALDEVHKRKIDASAAIFVVDCEGMGLGSSTYIGESTKSEILHATIQRKKIFYASTCLEISKLYSPYFPIPVAW
jgi:hypothetical protein